MADVTVTSADVRPLPGSIVRSFEAGATVTTGYTVYVDTAGKVQHGDADAEASSQVRGIAVTGPEGDTSIASGDRCDVVLFGPVAGFSSMTIGAAVYNSVTAGRVDQTAPATAGDYSFVVGWAESASILFVHPQTAVPSANQ